MKKVAILQSNYIPWKGYFDMIAAVDEFILYDDMQYTRQDWRNRNQVKTPRGVQWMSVPVLSKGRFAQTIRQTCIDGSGWSSDHWKTLVTNYKRAPHFDEIAAWLKPLYLDQTYSHLSDCNEVFIRAICDYLGIKTKITHSWDYVLIDGKSERLADLCLQAGALEYVSGPSAKDYADESVFNARGIKVTWFDYNDYPEYPQLWGEFTHGVTILDLLFNMGPEAPHYMRYVTR
jgi:hypothetical protein